MRGVVFIGFLGACAYTPPQNTPPTDGRIDAPIDVITIDSMPDTTEVGRVTSGLVGFWGFESASPLIDTSSFPIGNPQPINLTATATVVLANGTASTTLALDKLETISNPRLNADCIIGGGVTLEAWVQPTAAIQGGTNSLRVIAGLTSSINARNVSLFQAGDQWLARVRTNVDVNGAPDLVPATDQVVVAMTHLVVVADGDERILYVNGDPKATDAAPGPLTNWDNSYRLILGNEFQQSRPWTGTFELVALYNRALSQDEVQRNFFAGPTP